MTGVELEVTEGIRHVVLPSGAMVVPTSSTPMNGCKEEDIDKLGEIAATLRTSEPYKREKAGDIVPG
jgi:hypothetical protein